MSEQTFNFDSLQCALAKLREHELQTNTRFCVFTSTKDFGSTSLMKAKQVHWKDKPSVKVGRLNFTGVPFIVLGNKTFDCQFGKDRKRKAKQEKKEAKVDNDHCQYVRGKKFLLTDSKKFGCPARCVFREICRFPSYKVEENDHRQQTLIADDLLCRLKAGENIMFERLMVVCLPSPSDHAGHIVCADQVMPEPVDPRIPIKIKQLVDEGITDPGLVRVQLFHYVKSICESLPHPTNKRFYPCEKTIRNHIYRSKDIRLSDDQQRVGAWVNEMSENTEDFWFCRLKSESDEIISKSVHYGAKFLFVFQSKEQKRMLSRYGGTVFLDATYKTTIYDLPLFFVAVKTNVDYQIVGAFITEDETTASIEEALSVMKNECFGFSPPFFMTDFDESEISAIESVFQGSRVLICDFHRSQAWERWLSKTENAMGQKEQLMNMLRKIAIAASEEDLKVSMDSMKKSPEWESNLKFRNYFNRTWYPHHQRWVRTFRKGEMDVVASTNNGIESQHKIFKTSYLHRKTNNGLLAMLKVLVKDFFPARYSRYMDLNMVCSGNFRKFSSAVPEILHKRPKKFVKHCMEKMEEAKDKRCNVEVENGVFHIIVSSRTYIVQLGDEKMFPSCQCNDWDVHHMPCCHMFVAMNINGETDWKQISPLYMKSVYCTVDDLGCVDDKPSDDDVVHQESQESCDSTFANEADLQSTVIEEHVEEIHQEKTPENFDSGIVKDTSVDAKLEVKARDGLKRLMNITYNTTSRDVLQNIITTVDRLIVESQEREYLPSSKLIPLRRRKALKKYANRSGVKASIQRRHSKVHIPKDVKLSKTEHADKSNKIKDNVTACLPEDCVLQTSLEQLNIVKRLWKNPADEISPRLIGPYVLTTESIRCINSLISDEVIDGFLHVMVGRQTNQKVFHLNCIAMTSIFEGQDQIHHNLKGMPSLMIYDTIIGAFNEGGCHWCLIIIHPKERKIIYLNPLGRLVLNEQNIVLHWYKFLKSRLVAGFESSLPKEWIAANTAHSKQSDGSSCGLYVLKFAENYLNGHTLKFNWSPTDVENARLTLAVFVLSVSEPRSTSEHQSTPMEEDVGVELQVFVPKVEAKKTLRNILSKRKRSSYEYPKLKKQRKLYCLCQQEDDGRLYWQCTQCNAWLHPECINRDSADSPVPFFCDSCLNKHVENWPNEAVFMDDQDVDESRFLIDSKLAISKITEAYKNCFKVLSSTVKKSNLDWMKGHCEFVNNKGRTRQNYGYGFAVFSQEALITVEQLIRTTFMKRKGIFSLQMEVSSVANEILKQLLQNNELLAEKYFKNVLVKEALAAIMKEITGVSYPEVYTTLSSTETRKLSDSIKRGIEKCKEVKQMFQQD